MHTGKVPSSSQKPGEMLEEREKNCKEQENCTFDPSDPLFSDPESDLLSDERSILPSSEGLTLTYIIFDLHFDHIEMR